MLNHSFIRPLVGLPLAAIIVIGLFSMMQKLIAQDFVPPDASPQRLIEVLTPPDPDEADTRPRTEKPQRLDPAQKPPPPPRLSSGAADINLPMPSLQGSIPGLGSLATIQSLAPSPVAIDERDAQPIRKPLASYPRSMAERGIEGDCEVYLNVDPRGRPYDVRAVCTHDGFSREAERAVQRSEFAPKIVRGQPVAREGVVYPIEFRLNR